MEEGGRPIAHLVTYLVGADHIVLRLSGARPSHVLFFTLKRLFYALNHRQELFNGGNLALRIILLSLRQPITLDSLGDLVLNHDQRALQISLSLRFRFGTHVHCLDITGLPFLHIH